MVVTSKRLLLTHIESKHSKAVNDDIIIFLVNQLNGRTLEAEKTIGSYSYFATDKMVLNNKFYRLVWLLEENAIYIGVVYCYRR